MLTFMDLVCRFDGRPIPHCPGRYVLRGVDPTTRPQSVVAEGTVTEHVVEMARDKVVVTRLGPRGKWGLISYARVDGTWLHTVNSPGRFRAEAG